MPHGGLAEIGPTLPPSPPDRVGVIRRLSTKVRGACASRVTLPQMATSAPAPSAQTLVKVEDEASSHHGHYTIGA